MNKCLFCNAHTLNPKYCSRSCAARDTNKKFPKRRGKIRICKKCKIEFRATITHRSIIRCKDCKKPTRIESSKLTLKEVQSYPHLKKLHKSSLNAVVRQYCRKVNAHLPRKCQVCGYSLHVELCHIKSISSFPKTSTIFEVNNEDNILILCRNHHWEFDNGHIKLQDIPVRQPKCTL